MLFGSGCERFLLSAIKALREAAQLLMEIRGSDGGVCTKIGANYRFTAMRATKRCEIKFAEQIYILEFQGQTC
jgi:hypothetical protein